MSDIIPFHSIILMDSLSLFPKDKVKPEPSTTRLGRLGEDIAARYLEESGFTLVLSNFKIPVGRNRKGVQVTGEIDIIALDESTLCFVEVKTRRSEEFAPITANVDLKKQRQITRTAKVYRRIFNIRDIQYRFDVVTVLLAKHSDPEVRLIKGMWNESKFRKRSWYYENWDDFR